MIIVESIVNFTETVSFSKLISIATARQSDPRFTVLTY